jgi:XTP/dITP diphosphohydrolase
MREVVCATANPHKVEEMAAIFSGVVRLLPRPSDVGDIDETGMTLEDNACLKARVIALHIGAEAMADDTGLEIDALGGEPGVRSARYAGDDANDVANRALVLSRMKDARNRRARFRTVIAVATPTGECTMVVGECVGTIAHDERGTNGFGYDSIFIPDDGDGRTFAEMTADEKNAISHRARALSALLQQWS